MSVELSIVIPCYNEEEVMRYTLSNIYYFFDNHFKKEYEVILVIEKSDTKTADIVKEIANGRTVILENKKKEGKGYSLKRGIEHAKGKFVLLCDADLPVDIHRYFFPMYSLIQDEKVFAVYASAIGMKTSWKERGWFRANISLIFFILRQLFCNLPVADTQLGFKLFKTRILKEIVNVINERGFLFDLKLTYVLNKLGCEIEEVNVKVVERKKESSVSIKDILKDSIKFLYFVLIEKRKLKLIVSKYKIVESWHYDC